MSLSQIFWIIAAILIGLAYLGWVAIASWLVGAAFLVAGILSLLEAVTQPVVIPFRRQA